MSRVIGKGRPGVQGPADHHCCCPRGSLPSRGRPRLRRLPGVGQPTRRPLPRRGRHGVRTTLTTTTHASRRRHPPTTVELVAEPAPNAHPQGLDAGPDTIAWHLEHHHQIALSRATIYRILRRAEPRHRRTEEEAEVVLHPLPSRATQRDLAVRLHPLAASPTAPTSRSSPGSTTTPVTPCRSPPTTASPDPIVVATFRAAIDTHGIPFSTLTDNGLVFTTRFAHGGRTSPQRPRDRTRPTPRPPEELTTQPPHHLRQSRTLPTNHEDVATRPTPQPTRSPSCKHQLDTLRRPLQPPPTTPLTPTPRHPRRRLHHPPQSHTRHDHPDSEFRVRHDRVDKPAKSPSAIDGHLHHIGIGRPLAGTPIVLLIHDLDIRIIHATTGEIIRHLTLDPDRRYQPTGNQRGGPRTPLRTPKNKTTRTLMRVRALPMSRDITLVELRGIEPLTPSMPWKCSAN